jgi:hypothetical protein
MHADDFWLLIKHFVPLNGYTFESDMTWTRHQQQMVDPYPFIPIGNYKVQVIISNLNAIA